jgi:hypothetical protein
MPETFSVIFSTTNNNVVNADDISNVIYNVNWDTFLPKKYKKFDATFVFQSTLQAAALQENGFVGMNMGRVNVFDGQQSTTQQLGMFYPVLVGNRYYYATTLNDNSSFRMSYPNENLVTLTLRQFDKTALAEIPANYVLVLNLTGVDNKQLFENEPDFNKLY